MVSHQQLLGRIIVITGMSGSGKSTALNALEDSGFFCIDNLPVQLLPKFLAVHNESSPEFFKLGVVMDIREKEFVHQFKDVFSQVEAQDYDLDVIFLDATDESLVKRYSETRRRHPLAQGRSLIEAIHHERLLLAPVREKAKVVLDTSNFNTHQLRDIITQRFAQVELGRQMSVEFVSFGYKHGLPPEADIIMDVRFLPNPYWVDDLRELNGQDRQIVDFVMSGEEGCNFVEQFGNLLEFLIPLYRREGKTYLVVGVGCTGGQHRSVAVIDQLAKRFKGRVDNLSVRHRDVSL